MEKTAKALSTESRANATGYLLRTAASKRTGLSATLMVGHVE
jgi:hypothetical protein